MLESARKLLEIFAAWLENCSKYMLLGLAWLEFFKKMNCSKMLGLGFIFLARRALVCTNLQRLYNKFNSNYNSYTKTLLFTLRLFEHCSNSAVRAFSSNFHGFLLDYARLELFKVT